MGEEANEEYEHNHPVEANGTGNENGNGNEKDEEVDMDALRAAAIKSLGTNKEKESKDTFDSRSQTPSEGESGGEDDLESMRRLLLAQRAEKCPGDLRAKLRTKRKGVDEGVKGDTYYLNPSPRVFTPLTITRTVKNE